MNEEFQPRVAGRSALAMEAWLATFERWGDHLAVAVLLILPLLVFAGPALLHSVFYIHDVQYYFYPYHALSAAQLARGELPLWNPYTFSGIPLLGDGQTAMFYPPNWLFFILPAAAALNYAVILQFSIAGAGTYLFARALGLRRAPASLGAVAYMFCGFMTARVVHLSILSGAALVPLAFFCVERALRTGGRRWFAAAAGAVALQALAGHPQVPVYTALALGCYASVRAGERWHNQEGWRWLLRLPLRLAAIYLLGYGLAAIQLAPWIELGSFSPRAAGASFDFVFGGSMAGSNWLLLLFPYLYGSLGASIYSAQPIALPSAVKLWEHSAYVGMLPLALAAYGLLGLRSVPSRRVSGQPIGTAGDQLASNWFSVFFFALLLLASLVLAAGKYTPFAPLIYATPVIGKLRDVERAMALVAFALAMLAAFGLQRLIELPTRARRTSLLLLAISIVLAPLLVIFGAQRQSFQLAMNLQPHEIANLQLGRANAAVPLALAFLSATLLLWWSQRRVRGLGMAFALGLVALDLCGYAAIFNPTADPRIYRQAPDVLAAFSAEAAPFRKATVLNFNELDSDAARETLAVSWGMVYGVPDINGFNSLQPRRYTDYLFGPQVGDVSYGLLNNPRLFQPASPILSALNVKYLLVPTGLNPPLGSNFRQVYQNPQVRVYENTSAYPRAYFAETMRGATDPQAVLAAVTADGFDGRKLALVETAQPPALTPASGPATVTISQLSANQITISASTAQPRLLVLSEMYFPGWHAAIDGVETSIYRTNYLFRAVVTPAGQHTITFVYRPASLMLGAAISGTSLLLIAGLVLIHRRKPPAEYILPTALGDWHVGR